jgi:hypothetical protein
MFQIYFRILVTLRNVTKDIVKIKYTHLFCQGMQLFGGTFNFDEGTPPANFDTV